MNSVLLDLGSDGNFPIMAWVAANSPYRASGHAAQPGSISGRVIKGVWRVQIRTHKAALISSILILNQSQSCCQGTTVSVN